MDLIALVGPPGNISRFLQRIGRGNRRKARTAVVCFHRNEVERALFQVFIRASLEGTIETARYFFRPSVVAQQLFSYIKQTRFGEIFPDAAYELFASPMGKPLIARTVYDRIVEHLIVKGYFVAHDRGALRPGPQWQELYEKRAIYSNLADARQTIEVVDEMTGRKLGEIAWGVKPGKTFRFGGRTLRATHLNKQKLPVRASHEDASQEAPILRSPHRPLNHTLARTVAVEMILPGAESPNRRTIAPVMNEDEVIEENQTDIQDLCLFHYAGDAYGLLLGDLLESKYGVRVQDCNSFCLMLQRSQPPAHLGRRWQLFERWYDPGCFQRQLPLEVRRQTAIDAFGVAEFLLTFSGCEIIESA